MISAISFNFEEQLKGHSLLTLGPCPARTAHDYKKYFHPDNRVSHFGELL